MHGLLNGLLCVCNLMLSSSVCVCVVCGVCVCVCVGSGCIALHCMVWHGMSDTLALSFSEFVIVFPAHLLQIVIHDIIICSFV